MAVFSIRQNPMIYWLILITYGFIPLAGSRYINCNYNPFETYCTCEDSVYVCQKLGEPLLAIDYSSDLKVVTLFDRSYDISDEYPELPELPEDFLAQVGNSLTHLFILTNRLKAIRNVGTIGGCHAMTCLKIRSSAFNFLSPELITECSKLDIIIIENTKLSALPKLQTGELFGTTRFLLKENKISEVPDDFFSAFVNLMILDLSSNKLASVSAQWFHSCQQLLYVALQNNYLEVLPHGLFKNCVNLEEIRLDSNAIKNLSTDIFPSKNSKVRFLDLKNNLLHELPRNCFATAEKLEELDLSYNEIGELPEEFLGTCKRLRILNLESNNLQNVVYSSIENCTNLYELNLKRNRIVTLTRTFLANCPTLSSVLLDFNEIEALQDNFLQKCQSVRYISFTKNALKSLPSTLFKEARLLNTLKLNENNLTELPFGLTGNASLLQLLDVSHNSLQKLSSNELMVGDVQLLATTYNISYNSLKILHFGTFQFANLPTELDASHNQISVLEDGWTLGLQRLTILNLSYNELTFLKTRHVMLLDNLDELDISHNKLFQVEQEAFIDLMKLTYLDISDNRIVFENYYTPLLSDSIQVINISHNGFTFFPLSWTTIPSVNTIDLSYNNISQNDLMRILLSLTRTPRKNIDVWMTGNNIQCNCELHLIDRKYDTLSVVDVPSDQCFVYEDKEVDSCSPWKDCPEECECGRNKDNTVFIDCKDAVIKMVPHTVPSHVQMVDFSDSNITDVESLCQDSWKDLTHLTASNAFFKPQSTALLRNICLSSLKSLQMLDLSNNSITAVPENLLTGLSHLTSLNLSHNRFQAIPINLFSQAALMRSLDLSFTGIDNISHDLFVGMPSLLKLRLTGNRIKMIEDNTFSAMTLLSELYLQYNLIDNFPDSTLKELNGLQLLDVSHNLLKLYSMFYLPSSLVILRLKGNRISNTTPIIGEKLPSNLTTLDLSSNLLKTLDIDLHSFNNIYLNYKLEMNQIENINVIFNNVNKNVDVNNGTVIKLYLLGNPIICDCTLRSLIDLAGHKYIQHGRETNIHIVMDDATCNKPIFLQKKLLTELQLNDLLCETQCPSQCSCYSIRNGGVIMDCYAQPLTSLPQNIPPNVKKLYINNVHNISSLDALSDPQWENITSLWIRDCCIEMQTLNVSVLQNLRHLQSLDLDDNCICKTSENIQFGSKGFRGPCRRQLPPPVCSMNKAGQWIWRECSSNFDPPNYSITPMCFVEDGCGECICYLNNKTELVMNCSNRTMIALPKQVPNNLIILDMSFNDIVSLEGLTDNRFQKLKQLSVRHNKISELLDDDLPPNMLSIELDYNAMEKPSGWLNWLLSKKSNAHTYIDIAYNQWQCSCDPPTFQQWDFLKMQQYVRDINMTECNKDGTLQPLREVFQKCPETTSGNIQLVLGISLTIFFVALGFLTIIVYFWKSRVIKLWLFTRHWCMCLLKEERIDDDKQFDAFVSYSNEDSTFVAQTLLPGLEEAADIRFRYKICIHERDWLGGGYIPNQIMESVQISRRTIIVLSQNFINSTWANLEFKIALQQALNDRIDRIIVVIPEEVPNKDDMDPELRIYITMNSYIRYEDSKFWDKLRYAMPHKVPGGTVRRLPIDFIKMVKEERQLDSLQPSKF